MYMMVRTCPILALATSYHNLPPSRQKKTVTWLVLMKLLALHWNPGTSQALVFFFYLPLSDFFFWHFTQLHPLLVSTTITEEEESSSFAAS